MYKRYFEHTQSTNQSAPFVLASDWLQLIRRAIFQFSINTSENKIWTNLRFFRRLKSNLSFNEPKQTCLAVAKEAKLDPSQNLDLPERVSSSP